MVKQALIGLLALVSASFAEAAPQRVVSLNLCTDQLAMLVAAPEQLIAVSVLARDPGMSVMTEQAKGFAVTRGGAEEVFLLKPDLVLAGRWSTRATVEMLGSLGIEVVSFDPASSLADIRANLRKMGTVLGREDRAEALVAEFDAGLNALQETPEAGALRAAFHFSNSYTAGPGTLLDESLRTAGFLNIAAESGLSGMAKLPLESLIMADPDIVIRERAHDAPGRAQETFRHPALRALLRDTEQTFVTDAHTICGTPFILEAIRRLARVRHDIERAQLTKPDRVVSAHQTGD